MASAALPEGYSSVKRLHVGPLSEVYSALRTSDACEVVLKVYPSDTGAPRIPDAQREFDVLRALAVKGIPRVFELILEHSAPVLVSERAPGITMGSWAAAEPPALGAFLRVAVQIAEILAHVHAARFIHCDVNPWNILVDPATLDTHLIDFGLARRLGAADRSTPGTSGGLEGTLLYIAPEQTGRMNRGCDFRSDLYSLGAAFYQVLTGRPPFESSDPLELIHAHIARVPLPPIELRTELPQILSDLVLRLLRKEPEERYPSARALHADLLALQEQVARPDGIDPDFELAASEAPERPRFSRKLHGREREIALLRDLYAQVSLGTARALMLHGEPGLGKSALVEALGPQLAESGGYLAIGDFDLYRDRPYAGWETALGSLIQQILVESNARLEQWRVALRSGLGNIAQAMVDLLPDLKFIVGEVPAVPALGPRETQARLSLALQRLLSVCGAKDHPLVVFLDDLQWSDAGSRFLLEDLLCSGVPTGLLLIAGYRSDEVSEAHPLAAFLRRLAERNIALESLELRALEAEPAIAMLAEALERTAEETRSLGQLIERKTGNNPMLVRQFVEHIHERGLLHYERGKGWSWDPEQIAAADIPDGAVALMTAKIGRLEPEPRALIEFASCVGDEFDVEVLSELGRRERSALEQGLYALSDAGLIAPCPNGFRFVHGRIREAVQALLPEAARAKLHYDMARLLLARIPEAERAPRAFAIVEHLNRGLAHVSEELRLTTIGLNLVAGKRALASGAASTSEGYLVVARTLFRDQDWEQERPLGFSLLMQSAESALLRRDFDTALSLLEALERQSPSTLEAAQIEVKRIHVLALTLHPVECMRHVLGVLRTLGVRWPLHPSPARAWLVLFVLRLRVRVREGKELFRPAASADPRRLAPILIIGAAAGVIGRIDLNLGVLASCWVLTSNLRHGYFARPGYSLAVYANWLQLIVHDPVQAKRAVQLALEWGEKVPDPMYRPRMEMHIQGILRPWWMRRRQALAALGRIAESMREIGDLEYAYYARFLNAVYGALAGDAVPEAERNLLELADAVRRSGHRYPEPGRCQQIHRLLLAPELTGRVLDDAVAESDAWIAADQSSGEPYIRTLWMLVLCVFGRHDLAFAQSEQLGKRLFIVVPYVHIADHTFYRGLAAAALASSTRGANRRHYVKELCASQRRLRRWEQSGPDFLHMEQLLAAERARLQRDLPRARALYERAAQGARQQDFIHHAALACERRARMLTDLRRETEAAAALREAITCYGKWGCGAKTAALEEERRGLLGG